MQSLYLFVDKYRAIKVIVAGSYLRDPVKLTWLLFRKSEVGKSAEGKNIVYTLSIKVVSAGSRQPKAVHRKFLELPKEGKERNSFFYTPQGSWIQVHTESNIVECVMLENDYSFYEDFVLHAIFLVSIIVDSQRLHCAWLKRVNTSALLIGESSSGKTTTSNLLHAFDDKISIIDDDKAFLSYSEKGAFLYSFREKFYDYSAGLVFVIKDLSLLTEIYPISKREALKRLFFHADMIMHKKEDDSLIKRRIESLQDFVSRSRSYVLINGKDLKKSNSRAKAYLRDTVFNI